MADRLKKRPAFRKEFAGFEPEKAAEFDEEKIEKMLQNPQIIRSRQKICAAVGNAKVFLQIQLEFGSFDKYLWHFTNGKTQKYNIFPCPVKNELSDTISKDLKKARHEVRRQCDYIFISAGCRSNRRPRAAMLLPR